MKIIKKKINKIVSLVIIIHFDKKKKSKEDSNFCLKLYKSVYISQNSSMFETIPNKIIQTT